MPFPDSFLTRRLAAERLRPSHYADILRMHQDPVQMAFLGGVRDEAQTTDYLERNLHHWGRYGFGVWVLRDKVSGGLAGRALLRHLQLDERDEVEVGYSLMPPLWGRGLATEITVACLEHGYTLLGLTSIVALTRPENRASQRVLVKAGLTLQRELLFDQTPHLLFRRNATADRADPTAAPPSPLDP